MPNPIKSFAMSTMQNIFGNTNENVVILENGIRYQALTLLKLVPKFGTRSMSLKGIVFPYWENVARGNEDILVLTLLFKIILLVAPVFFVIRVSFYYWKKRTWTVRKGISLLQDKIYEFSSKRAQKKQKEQCKQEDRQKLEEDKSTKIESVEEKTEVEEHLLTQLQEEGKETETV